MPGRRVLKSVAHDVGEALVSRNDDLRGYWTLGQLLAHALASNHTRLEVDLVCGASKPSLIGTPLDTIPSSWTDVFWTNVEHKKIPRAFVGSATAVVDFDLSSERPAAVRAGLREHSFACQLRVNDDRGRTYAWSTEGWCFPHDPSVEHRSARGA